MGKQQKKKILIADDSPMNRALLLEMLEDQFEILEAENGKVAVELLSEHRQELSLVLLDILMPEMDGFEVLAVMNKYHWIEEMPVIIISAETSPSYIDRAYDFGAMDFITRPFNLAVVRRRVENTLLLFAKERKLTNIVTEQIFKNKQSSRLMISVLAQIVEFRNGESGLHVLHINTITSLLLQQLRQKENRYGLDQEKSERITTASTLHDIGKISIPEEILNKPGKLTSEEFEMMKTHSMIGAKMLSGLSEKQREDPLIQTAYEICRWHHERYDGRGYPDGLKGEEIPISAQVVSLADVYDALTSERCYKKAFSHEAALEMILQGQCGAFHPMLLECLREISESLKVELAVNSDHREEEEDLRNVADQLHDYGLLSSERMADQEYFERHKVRFFSDTSEEIFFVYTASPPMLTLNKYGARRLGLEELLTEPLQEEKAEKWLGQGRALFREKMAAASPENPDFGFSSTVSIDGQPQGCDYECHTVWTSSGCYGAIGKLLLKRKENLSADREKHRLKKLAEAVEQISAGRFELSLSVEGKDEIGRLEAGFQSMTEHLTRHLDELSDLAYRDSLTSVRNRVAYQKDAARLDQRLKTERCDFAVIVLDVNYLKYINNTYGHALGDELLVKGCKIICGVFQHSPVYRIGGDEFVVILEREDLKNDEELTETLRHSMVEIDCLDGTAFKTPISMGIARYEQGKDLSFDDVFRRADALMYENKLEIKSAHRLFSDLTDGSQKTVQAGN
ncbi:bifunctional diguanylate cyclase/phosphohydrolase [Neglectibacter caecimuris]|uniref:bifunctional diguanylate cyclase/phosphohydrolase n=1 Tax=Neglectibacter caecimuris TaxID=3093658 RepID=UPI002AC9C1E7|nr:HD domain-containing phosphohydrolase [Neglectibacter sp. M00184]